MGFLEDFEKFKNPKKEKESETLLPSFDAVRNALKEAKKNPVPEQTLILTQNQRNLDKVLQDKEQGVSLSAPKGNEIPLLNTKFLKDHSTEKQGFKLSDLILPEVRKGFSQSFGDSEKGSASDIYTEMIPSFGKNRAYEIANAYQNGVDAFGYPAGVKLTDIEKSQFDGWKQKHWALLTLDASDVLGVGIAIKAGASFIGRTGLRRVMSAAVKLDNIKDMHELILRELPELKGTQELDDITDIITASKQQNPDKLAEIVQKRVEDPNLAPRSELSTAAQKVTYEDGVPVLRQTTPDTLVERRVEGLEAIKGNREALRLSNADILAEEIRAGSLPLKTTADDTIEVWRATPRGRRVKVGEEVSITEKFADSLAEGIRPQKIEVPVADLIRLPDGSFTYAPERLITESPVLKFPKNLSDELVQATKKKEADIVAKKLATEKADKEAKRVAKAQAEERLMRPVKEAELKLKLAQEKPINIKADAQKKVVEIRHIRDKDVAKAKPKDVPDIKAKAAKDIIAVNRERDLAVKTADAEVKSVKSEVASILKKAVEDTPTAKGTDAVTETTTKTVKGSSNSKKESLKPVGGGGAVKESKLYESTQKNVREAKKNLGQTINTKEYEFYRTASNKDQIAKASAYIETNGVDETIKALEVALRTGGDTTEGILNNSLLLALEPMLLESGMAKHADALLRLSSRLATRMGQEIQILSMLDRNNPLAVLYRLNKDIDKMVDGGGIIGSAAKKGTREKTFNALNETINKAIDSKENLTEALAKIDICK